MGHRLLCGNDVLDLFNRFVLHAPLAVAHVPEVRLASIELRARPRPPDGVVMDMVRREIIGDDFPGRSRDRMQIAGGA